LSKLVLVPKQSDGFFFFQFIWESLVKNWRKVPSFGCNWTAMTDARNFYEELHAWLRAWAVYFYYRETRFERRRKNETHVLYSMQFVRKCYGFEVRSSEQI
jgi:hypothetical protein